MHKQLGLFTYAVLMQTFLNKCARLARAARLRAADLMSTEEEAAQRELPLREVGNFNPTRRTPDLSAAGVARRSPYLIKAGRERGAVVVDDAGPLRGGGRVRGQRRHAEARLEVR